MVICRYRIYVLQVGGLNSCVFSHDTVLRSVKEEGDGPGAEEDLGRYVLWNDAILVVELEVAEAELNCAPVGLYLGVFTRAQTE